MIRCALLCFILVLGGCVHVQPSPSPGCALVAYPLRVDGGSQARALGQDFEAVLGAAMSTPAPGAPGELNGARPSVLILSGGSQHGAFGAGFFAGLPSVTDYKLVTAVSTGALQSTFLFLANQPVPADRRYAAYFKAEAGTPHSNVGDLVLAYSIDHESDLLDVGSFGEVGGVVRGSIANFGPLRNVLRGLLSPETLRAVGRAYRPDPRYGRRLLVGVTDVNDGAGYAIDLTELASRFAQGRAAYEPIRECYVDTLIASSSVPLAVPPVTLEVQAPDGRGAPARHMFIDGGARFGVFWSQLGEVLAGLDPEVTLIVNGKLYGKPWTDKAGRPYAKWSSITLGLRAVDILENQVYRFSVDNVNQAAAGKGSIRMAFISAEGPAGSLGDPDEFQFNGRSCARWSEEDDKAKPTEFHPHYMRCLLEYGRARGQANAWNKGK